MTARHGPRTAEAVGHVEVAGCRIWLQELRHLSAAADLRWTTATKRSFFCQNGTRDIEKFERAAGSANGLRECGKTRILRIEGDVEIRAFVWRTRRILSATRRKLTRASGPLGPPRESRGSRRSGRLADAGASPPAGAAAGAAVPAGLRKARHGRGAKLRRRGQLGRRRSSPSRCGRVLAPATRAGAARRIGFVLRPLRSEAEALELGEVEFVEIRGGIFSLAAGSSMK